MPRQWTVLDNQLNPVAQPEPVEEIPQLVQAEEPSMFERGKRFLTEPLRMSPDKAAVVTALAETEGLSPSMAAENFDFLTTGLRDQPTPRDLVDGVFQAGVTAGLITHPVGTIMALGGFMALDQIGSLESFVPVDASQNTKDLVNLADVLIKGAAVGGTFAVAKSKLPARILEKARKVNENPTEETVKEFAEVLNEENLSEVVTSPEIRAKKEVTETSRTNLEAKDHAQKIQDNKEFLRNLQPQRNVAPKPTQVAQALRKDPIAEPVVPEIVETPKVPEPIPAPVEKIKTPRKFEVVEEGEIVTAESELLPSKIERSISEVAKEVTTEAQPVLNPTEQLQEFGNRTKTAIEEGRSLDNIEKDLVDFYQNTSEEVFEFESDKFEFADKSEQLLGIIRKTKRRMMQETGPDGQGSSVMIKENPLEPFAAEDLILNSDGKPFSTKLIAEFWLFGKDINGKVVPNPTGGFAIKSATGSGSRAKPLTDSSSSYLNKATDILNDESGKIEIDIAPLVNSLKEQGKQLKEFFTFKTWPDIASQSYKNVYGLVKDLRINQNLAAFDAQKLGESIQKSVPDPTAREGITKFLDNPSGTLADPQQVKTAMVARELLNSYRKRLEDSGILTEFWDNYVPHVIKKGIKDEQKATNTKNSYIKRRVRKDDNTFFSLEELEARGFTVEKDIATLMTQYVFNAERALSQKAFADALMVMKTPEGKPLILPQRKALLDENIDSYIKIDDSKLRQWSRFSGDAVKQKLRKDLFVDPTYVHKDGFSQIDNIFAEPVSEMAHKVGVIRAGIKRLRMYNPLVHGFNVESNVIMALGHQYPKRFKARTPEELNALQRRMTESGVELEGLFDIGKRLGLDEFSLNVNDKISIKDALKDPVKALTHPIKTIKDIGDTILWDKWVKTGQVAVFETLESRFLNEGLGPKDASEAASNITNDLLGTLPIQWFTKGQRRGLNNLLFARNWTVSNLRTLTGAIPALAKSKRAPKPIRFEGLNDAQLKVMGKAYRGVLFKGVLGTLTTGALIQGVFLKSNGQEYHAPWNNEQGHELDIDTGIVDEKGRKVYVKNWLFRQIDDYVKMLDPSDFPEKQIQFVSNKLEPMLKLVIDVLKNADFTGRPILEPGANLSERVGSLSKYIARGIIPMENFVGRESEVKAWRDIILSLTGTWVRHGMPAGGSVAAGDMLKDFYNWRDIEKFQDKKLKTDLSLLIQRDKIDEAVDLAVVAMEEGRFSPGKLGGAFLKIQAPLFSRIASQGGKLNSEFVKFILSQPEKKQEKYVKALQGEFGKAKSNVEDMTVVPQEKGTVHTHRRWEVVQ